ncbi:MAG TPA: VanW family protein [Polyangiaceae bacterium]|nr:VanW family protein [Polyangiaceae bacterium]
MHGGRLALVVAALAAGLGGALLAVRSPLELALSPPLDVSFDGRILPPRVEVAEWLEERQRAIRDKPVDIDAGGEHLTATFRELGWSLDTRRMLERAQALPRAETLMGRLQRAFGGPPLLPPELPLRVVVDEARSRAYLEELARRVYRAPRNAARDVVHHENVHEADGRELALESTLARLETSAELGHAAFELSFRTLPPKVFLRDLPEVDVSRVLGAYETDFKHHAGARSVNIRRAAALLNGMILQPGERFSFNRRVGPRTLERGFVEAPVLVKDETEKGPGGGVCQVATTLHAAAVLGGLTMLERRSHSRPSGYAPLGLDATVIDGKVDLRFENSLDTPLVIHAFLPTPTSIRVELLGHDAPGQVEHTYRVIERHPYFRRIVESSEVARGNYERKQKGSPGYDVVSFVRTTEPNGSVVTRRYKSKYWPVPEVLWVGPGTDVAELPPLPDGSAGLEPTESGG